MGSLAAAADPSSPITDNAIWKDRRPVSFSELIRPPVDSERVWEPNEKEWKYSHHQSVTVFGEMLLAIWSSAERDEDSPGQRVMYAFREPGAAEWSKPRILFQPDIDRHGQLRVLTASGFHQYKGTLVAYAGDYSTDRKSTKLWARTSVDGKNWTEPRDLGVAVCPNHPPQPTSTGRLIIAGNTAFPYTDDPTGLAGWRMTGIYGADLEPFQDNPGTFWDVTKHRHWPADVCEGAFYETDDHALHMLLRATNPGGLTAHDPFFKLWESVSTDNGATWSEPRETSFSNTDAKIHCGRLPDGRFYCLGNPLDIARIPLVLSTSRDGVNFDQHYLLGDRKYKRRFDGGAKGGEYGYPHSTIHAGRMYVVVSRQKEAIDVLSVSLSDLAAKQ